MAMQVRRIGNKRSVFMMFMSLILGLSGMFSSFFDASLSSVAYAASAGDTEDNPIMVTTPEELDGIRYGLHKHYRLGADIDLSDFSDPDGKGWKPIGTSATNMDPYVNTFQGSLDGAGHRITGLTINRPDENYLGLFGWSYKAKFKNIRFEKVRFVACNNITGSLTGAALNSDISNITITDVQMACRNNFVGGIAGEVISSTVSNSSVENGKFSSMGPVGGLIGSLNESTLAQSYAIVQLKGISEVGGLVGNATNSAIRESYAAAKSEGRFGTVGGLVGRFICSEVYDSYATGIVAGERDRVGGLIGGIEGGWCGQTNIIDTSYAASRVIGSPEYVESTGGLVGDWDQSDLRIKDAFWDIEQSGWTTSQGGIGKTTAELAQPDNYSNWDFSGVWERSAGRTYPYLQWSNPLTDIGVNADELQMKQGDTFELTASAFWDGAVFDITGAATIDSDDPDVAIVSNHNEIQAVALGKTHIRVRYDGMERLIPISVFETSYIQFSFDTYTAAENSGEAIIYVSREGGTGGVVSVVYGTSDGSAAAGTDYVPAQGELVFAKGETIQSFTVTLLDNDTYEGDRTVNLSLGSPQGGAELGSPSEAVLTIVDDEVPSQAAYTVQAESVDPPAAAGTVQTVTINVYRSDGKLDTSYNRTTDVTITGYAASPDGTAGSFAGRSLTGEGTSVSIAFVDGMAEQPLILHRAASQTIRFRVADIAYPETNALLFHPTSAEASRMEIVTQPLGPAGKGGGLLQRQPQIRVTDSFGNPVSGVPVRASQPEDTALWTLTGSESSTQSDGIATFADLRATTERSAGMNQAFLIFGAEGLPEKRSDSFAIKGTYTPSEPEPSRPGNPSASATSPQPAPAKPDDSDSGDSPELADLPEEERADAGKKDKPVSLPFRDVQRHWAYEEIARMFELGLIDGYPDGTFQPDRTMTRAELATIVANMMKPASTEETAAFQDTANHWAKQYIASAKATGIVEGYSDSLFGPDDPVSREQMMVMIVKALLVQTDRQTPLPSETTLSFIDERAISDWARAYVGFAVNRQFVSGYPDRSFRPKAPATRAEVVKVIADSGILDGISNE
ncbi:S-layer homology domain-containing protein [Paenibacillus sp. MSJ-34]|uniref:S-layer homology domain-containing protein n=1 Tax=Paenibacillus sp. MSJ-34 TaxID=2841529 RepID=UPI001C11151B|nr:S-layer homology domain-containing protein [Paenibacillus sp. MSJ-34]MBU5442516.1 S-layer homology domain-containing protein [Paenibacillus sp. MSJ-34]